MNGSGLLRLILRYRLTGAFIVGALVVLIALVVAQCWTADEHVFAKPSSTISFEDIADSIALSPDGQEAMAVMRHYFGNTEFIRRWALPDGLADDQFAYNGCVAYSSTGDRIAVGAANGIQINNRQSNAKLFTLSGSGISGGISETAFSTDGKWLALRDNASCVHIWNLTDGSGPQSIRVSSGAAGFSLSPSGDMIIVVRRTTECEIWNLSTFQQVAVTAPLALNDICMCCAANSKGDLLAIATGNGRIVVWNTAEQRTITSFAPRFSADARQYESSLCFAADDSVLFAVVNTGRLMLIQQPIFPYFSLGRDLKHSEFKAFRVGDWNCVKTWRGRNWVVAIMPVPGGRNLLSHQGRTIDIWHWDDLSK